MRRLAPLAVLSLAAACAHRAPPPDLSLEPAALRAQVAAAAARVDRVQGQAWLRASGQGVPAGIRAFVAAGKPDRLHVETLDFFGNPVAALVTEGGRLSLYDGRARTFYRGEASPANLARLVPLPLPPEELVAVLCGSVPLVAGDAVRADPGRGFVTLELAGPGARQTLRVGPRAAVERASLRGPAVPEHDVGFSQFRTVGDVRFPTEIALAASHPDVRLDVAWREFELNGAVDPALFRMEPPKGARIVELDAGAAPPPLLPGADPEGAGTAP